MELATVIPIVIPDNVKNQIKYLCKKIAKVEWSGVLFYAIEGSIKDASKMKIVLKDILLMDRGTSAYTSFDWDEDVVAYQMDNPHILEEDWKIGHIHSHNTMNVFFSGTDWSELNDNSPLHNFYLSVIVNNYYEITAKIAFTAQQKVFTCKDENGKDYKLTLTKSSLDPMMFVYDCEIVGQEVEVPTPKGFDERIELIDNKAKIKFEEEKRKKEEEDKKKKTYLVQNTTVKNQLDLYKGKTGFGKNADKFPDYNGSNWKSNAFDSLEALEADDFKEKEDEDSLQTIEQEFATYVLRLGENEDMIDDEIVDALEDIEEAIKGGNLNIDTFSSSIVDTYGALHGKFFERISKYHGDEKFMEMLENVITEFEQHERDYPFLADIISKLRELGNKFENYMKDQELLTSNIIS